MKSFKSQTLIGHRFVPLQTNVVKGKFQWHGSSDGGGGGGGGKVKHALLSAQPSYYISSFVISDS